MRRSGFEGLLRIGGAREDVARAPPTREKVLFAVVARKALVCPKPTNGSTVVEVLPSICSIIVFPVGFEGNLSLLDIWFVSRERKSKWKLPISTSD